MKESSEGNVSKGGSGGPSCSAPLTSLLALGQTAVTDRATVLMTEPRAVGGGRGGGDDSAL